MCLLYLVPLKELKVYYDLAKMKMIKLSSFINLFFLEQICRQRGTVRWEAERKRRGGMGGGRSLRKDPVAVRDVLVFSFEVAVEQTGDEGVDFGVRVVLEVFQCLQSTVGLHLESEGIDHVSF